MHVVLRCAAQLKQDICACSVQDSSYAADMQRTYHADADCHWLADFFGSACSAHYHCRNGLQNKHVHMMCTVTSRRAHSVLLGKNGVLRNCTSSTTLSDNMNVASALLQVTISMGLSYVLWGYAGSCLALTSLPCQSSKQIMVLQVLTQGKADRSEPNMVPDICCKGRQCYTEGFWQAWTVPGRT